ncbi:YHYH protein [Chitinophagaceae bacterium MMS25-I14]
MSFKFGVIIAAITASLSAAAQGPEVTSWVINTTGATGYGGISSNVQQVQYSANNVYISATCIPGYSIGPWNGNPNTPSNQNFVFKITRSPQKNTGTLTAIGLGHTGVWTNGVSIFNVSDAQSYNNAGVWNRNAYFFEGSGFDNCLGHPQGNGEYHHHVSPTCLYNDKDSTHHSPIIGYAFDGYPVYGAYGYADTNGGGGIKRMTPSYQARNITTRTTLPDGSAASSAGPAVSATYPVGSFIEDYVYTAGSGDLDEHNGRWCKTPEYPNGTYAYFVTIDGSQTPVFPYTMYGTYYGIVQSGNAGPNSGHNTITETTTTYTPTAVANAEKISTLIYPNPTSEYLFIYINPIASNNFTVSLTDVDGRTVLMQPNIQPTISYTLDVRSLARGIYTLTLRNEEKTYSEQVLIK